MNVKNSTNLIAKVTCLSILVCAIPLAAWAAGMNFLASPAGTVHASNGVTNPNNVLIDEDTDRHVGVRILPRFRRLWIRLRADHAQSLHLFLRGWSVGLDRSQTLSIDRAGSVSRTTANAPRHLTSNLLHQKTSLSSRDSSAHRPARTRARAARCRGPQAHRSARRAPPPSCSPRGTPGRTRPRAPR